ncbi:hypothetical protein HYH03_011967 [Edaphochlamys debaryana]|uniref:Uncharacterized protein n=1 Tax=Edaphochlamys debaryana TaxID=47281 RepID=A0A835XW97_9CHLO|nr:hypothetical protein HYH03_011967 [Edaphochlamys debaryana]|eukprot:KAG2489516.1 hypothetical protein HYH03_011967 [Edaphochlamys debaryana]
MGQEPDVPRLEVGGWKLTLEHITRLAVKGLGLAEADAKLCEARLAQLTAVEAGRHSKERLDIKKQPGTLGKLLVQLPVVGCHTGGELHVKHEGRRQVFWRSAPPDGGGGHGAEERKAGPVELRYAAFYADCDTQLLPVESGRRVVLVYDLIRTGPQHPLCLLALRGDDLAALVSSAPCPAFARLVGAFGALPPVEVVRPAALAAGPWCAAAPLWWNPALPVAAGGAGLEADFPDLFTLGPLTSVGVAVRCWDAFRAVRVERAALRPGQPPSPRQRRRWTRQSFECEDTGDSDAEDVEPWDETSIVKWRNPGPRAGGKGKATASFPEELGLQGLLDQLEDRLLGGGELLSDEPGKRRQPDGAQLNNAALVVFWPRSHTASAASDLELCLQLAASAILPERLRDSTCSALMGSLLAPDVFRLRPLPFVHRLLAGLVFGPDPRFGAHSGAFADALLARPDAQEVLRALLRDAEAVIWAVKERRPQAVRLAQGRRRQLEAETAGGEPAVRWEMPGARLPAYPQVEAFLRGPQQSFRLNPRINNITHVAPSHGAHAPCSNVADPPTCFVVALLCEARL